MPKLSDFDFDVNIQSFRRLCNYQRKPT